MLVVKIGDRTVPITSVKEVKNGEVSTQINKIYSVKNGVCKDIWKK